MAKMADINALGITNLYDYLQGIEIGVEAAIKILSSKEAQLYLGVGFDLEGLAEVIREESSHGSK